MQDATIFIIFFAKNKLACQMLCKGKIHVNKT